MTHHKTIADMNNEQFRELVLTSKYNNKSVFIIYDKHEKKVIKILDQDQEPNLLIVGDPQSGKTSVMKDILVRYFINKGNDSIIFLADPFGGGEGFSPIAGKKNVYFTTGVTKHIKRVIAMIYEEAKDRIELFKENGCETYKEYLQKGHYLPRIVLAIEELQFLTELQDSKGNYKASFKYKLSKLFELTKHTGISVIATARGVVAESDLTKYFSNTFALRLEKEKHSIICVGHKKPCLLNISDYAVCYDRSSVRYSLAKIDDKLLTDAVILTVSQDKDFVKHSLIKVKSKDLRRICSS